jgi:hypothetical protein
VSGDSTTTIATTGNTCTTDYIIIPSLAVNPPGTAYDQYCGTSFASAAGGSGTTIPSRNAFVQIVQSVVNRKEQGVDLSRSAHSKGRTSSAMALWQYFAHCSK